MPLQLVSPSSPRVGVVRRILVCAALVALGYLTALIAQPSRELPSAIGTGAAAVRQAAVPSSGRSEAARDFDYFPDHYVNQAKTPAEPIDTF